MADARLADGTPQSLYFPDGHELAGRFKGMQVILEERGYDVKGLRAECKGFKCEKGLVNCCMRRMLYSEPDFVDVKSKLEIECEARGYSVVFLPKFHCELNFIEQCWCEAKRTYRNYPPSSSEADLESNVVRALESITVVRMRK